MRLQVDTIDVAADRQAWSVENREPRKLGRRLLFPDPANDLALPGEQERGVTRRLPASFSALLMSVLVLRFSRADRQVRPPV